MLPGVPFEVDEVLSPDTFQAYFRALLNAMPGLDSRGSVIQSLRIYKGMLFIRSDKAPELCIQVHRCCAGCD